jgi:hypothetical protein
MKSNEKKLVGLALAAGGIALIVGLGLPQWDAFSTNSTKATGLKSDLTASDSQKEDLNVQISLLEKNIDIPAYIKVKTFTNDTEASATKELLDQVVTLATTAGNKFISLSPAEVEPFMAPPKPKAKAADGSTPADEAAPADGATDDSTGKKAAVAYEPPLVTKGYELTVRGTYNTIQSFLRAMDKQVLILDMLNFDLENEAGDTANPAAASNSDPNFPLRLKVTLRLALQRLESMNNATK